MSSSSSFDIGSYFNTLSIDEKLSQIIEYNEANSPSQLEYNKSCREVFDGVESFIRESSLSRIIEGILYFPGLPERALDEKGAIKADTKKMMQEMPPIDLFVYCYGENPETMQAPILLIGFLREAYLNDFSENTSLAEGLKYIKEYEKISKACRKTLADHVEEHLTKSGSNTVNNDEEFDEPITFSFGENRKIQFTHPMQVFPVLDLSGLSISSTISPAAKVARLPENYNIYELSGSHLKGDATNQIIKGILRRMAPAIYSQNSSIAESPQDNTNNYTLKSALDNETSAVAPSSIMHAIDKAASIGICQASSIDIDRCKVDGRKVHLYNKIGMFVCQIEL